MSQRLSRVVFATPVQDPSAPGQFERRDFNKNCARTLTLERAADGTVTLTAPDGSQVIASGIPYWCNPLRVEYVPVELLPEQPTGLPPVNQTQAHPRDRIYRGKRT